MTTITPHLLKEIWENQRVRQPLAFEHPLWFSLLYLRQHFTYSLAPFHVEMFHLIRHDEYAFIVVMAFRESGKSTILNTANVLWSILGKPQKKFAIIISKTQEQAKNHFLNTKAELVTNKLLKEDFGPFAEHDDDLKRLSLELEYHNSKIMSVTRDQSIRGLKYEQFRPDLIICDDLEDISSARDHKESDALYEWFTKEVVPMGSKGTKIVMLGNLLSENSLIMKLKKDIDEGTISGIFRAYPLLDNLGKNLWQGKFTGEQDLKSLREKLSQEAWTQEYLLSFDNMASYEHDATELPDLDPYENNDAFILGWYQGRRAKLWGQYRADLSDAQLQSALIDHMKKFKISAPLMASFVAPEMGDVQYEKYVGYEAEQKKLVNKFHEALKGAIQIRSLERAREEGEII